MSNNGKIDERTISNKSCLHCRADDHNREVQMQCDLARQKVHINGESMCDFHVPRSSTKLCVLCLCNGKAAMAHIIVCWPMSRRTSRCNGLFQMREQRASSLVILSVCSGGTTATRKNTKISKLSSSSGSEHSVMKTQPSKSRGYRYLSEIGQPIHTHKQRRSFSRIKINK